MNDYEQWLSHLILFAQSLGIGFLVGLDRERREGKIAGIRTFTLIALAGSASGYISVTTGLHYVPWVLITLIGAGLLIAQHRSSEAEPETTTVLAALLTFLLGYMLWIAPSLLVAALAITMTAVLYFRQELRSLPHKLTRQDVTSFLQFAAVAFILLPILPDESYGPYKVFNPYQVGWLVILISGISLLGYVALRLLKGHSGIYAIGLLGGLVSTTATTMVYSRHSKQNVEFTNSAATIILLAHLVLFVRAAVVIAILGPELLPVMLPWLAGGLIAGFAALYVLMVKKHPRQQTAPELTVSNPTEWKSAIGFALGYALVLFLSAWMNDVFAQAGVYAVAFVSGLTDVDAITIANLKLVSTGKMDVPVAVIAIVIAFIANFIFKSSIVVVTANPALRKPILITFALISMGILVGLTGWLMVSESSLA